MNPTSAAPQPRPHILVVDDKENMRLLLQKILDQWYDVTAAADVPEAITALQGSAFDLVLTDIRMPDADGFELVRMIKQHWPTIEVVVMTAFASIESAVEAIRLGAYDYIQKPFDPDEISLVLARALEGKRSRQSRQPPDPSDTSLSQMSYREAVNLARERMSRDYLSALLRHFAGNVSQAADRAGMERESLHRLIKRYGVRADEFRESARNPNPQADDDPPDKQ
jgi:DNA-binding NtrC family response regulator